MNTALNRTLNATLKKMFNTTLNATLHTVINSTSNVTRNSCVYTTARVIVNATTNASANSTLYTSINNYTSMNSSTAQGTNVSTDWCIQVLTNASINTSAYTPANMTTSNMTANSTNTTMDGTARLDPKRCILFSNNSSVFMPQTLFDCLFSFPWYEYVIILFTLILLGVGSVYLFRRLNDKWLACYYKYCHKVKGPNKDEETPRYDDEVHVELVPDVLLVETWQPPPTKICDQCNRDLTIFNTSKHNLCTTCNLKKIKDIEQLKERKMEEFRLYKIRVAKEQKILLKSRKLKSQKLNGGENSQVDQESKEKLKKKVRKKKRQTQEKRLKDAPHIEEGLSKATNANGESTISSMYITGEKELPEYVLSMQDSQEPNSEKTEPLGCVTEPSLPQMDISIPTESVIQNSMNLRHHGKALSILRDKYIKKRMKNHVIVNTVFGSKQFSDRVLGLSHQKSTDKQVDI